MARLEDRKLIEVSGEEARGFLHGLLTCAVEPLAAGEARFGALLSAQGKLLYDFFLVATADGFLIECDGGGREGLLKRLMLYRLRAKVTLAARDDLAVLALPAAPVPSAHVIAAFADPRHPGLGFRALVTAEGIAAADVDFDWEERRLALGVPAGGRDFAYGDVFPADANMEALGGVDFKKGCFVGQEVVARMKHRATARWRMLVATGTAPLPAAGTPVLVADKSIGAMGTSRDGRGLALVRIDKAADARRSGQAAMADGRAVTLDLPAYATFAWPEATGE
jgi:tRNA-modifying protein YgfZ